MGHEETHNTQETGSQADMPSFGTETGRSLDESGVTAMLPELETTTSQRERAMEIFRSREFEGESLRMGQVLRRVREELGMNIADISRKSLLRKDFLMWIERMEIGQIPKGYLTPYLRAYCV